MSSTKKINEDIVKDIRNSINDLSKTLETACDPSRQITLEIIEYFKKRIEIENDYGSRMSRLGEKLSEKVQKITPLVQFKDMPDTRYELYNLLKVIESEVKEKVIAVMKYYETIYNHIIPALNKYNDFNALKHNKNKKLLSNLSENLVQGINIAFYKNQIYSKDFLIELKSKTEYDSYIKRKNSKSVKSPEKVNQKLMKLDNTYKENIFNTDRSRNQYLFAYFSSKRCQDSFFKLQTSQIVLNMNLKYGEFWSYFLTTYTTALKELNEASNANLKTYNKLVFSDDVESDVFLERYKNKFFEKIVKFPLIISRKDRANKVMCDGPLRAELERKLWVIEDNIQKIQDELSESLKLISEKKAIKIQWEKDSFSLDSLKESKNHTLGKKSTLNEEFDYNEYLQIFEKRLNLEMSFYNERTKLSLIKMALGDETGNITNDSSLDTRHDKKRIEFGVDIVQHCTMYNVKIPELVTLCSKYLYSNDLLKTVGIFRVSPASSDVKEIMTFLTENGYIKDGSNAAAVASIMKQYLRSMKNFISIKDLPKILSSIAYTEKKKYIEETRKIMDQIPIQSRDLLIFIAKFLRHIADMSDVNKMDLHNLSVVFGQTLFSQEQSGEKTFDYQADVNVFLKVFCERVFEIFPEESKLLEFEETRKARSEENTYLDIVDDGANFDSNNIDIDDDQNIESTLNKDTNDDTENSSSNISLTDLPPPDGPSPPNDGLINVIETLKKIL